MLCGAMLEQFLLWITISARFAFIPVTIEQPWATGGFAIYELKAGTGREVRDGDLVTIHVVAATLEGKEIANSEKRGLPLRFVLGNAETPAYLDLAVRGMSLGAERRVVLPPELAFGADGEPPIIPPNATLSVRVRVVRIEKAKPDIAPLHTKGGAEAGRG